MLMVVRFLLVLGVNQWVQAVEEGLATDYAPLLEGRHREDLASVIVFAEELLAVDVLAAALEALSHVLVAAKASHIAVLYSSTPVIRWERRALHVMRSCSMPRHFKDE